jgi:hypothetical protein
MGAAIHTEPCLSICFPTSFIDKFVMRCLCPPWKSESNCQIRVRCKLIHSSLDPKVVSLASRLVESNRPHHEDDDEALFAELEAEIENDNNASVREKALDVLQRE